MQTDAQQPSSDDPREPERGISERIKQRRKELDLTVEMLAALTARYEYATDEGISVPTLYRYEKGDRLPGARELRLLSGALNVSPNWLLLGHEWDSGQQQDAELGRALLALLGTAEARRTLSASTFDREAEHRIKVAEVKQERR